MRFLHSALVWKLEPARALGNACLECALDGVAGEVIGASRELRLQKCAGFTLSGEGQLLKVVASQHIGSAQEAGLR